MIFTGLYTHVLWWHCIPYKSEEEIPKHKKDSEEKPDMVIFTDLCDVEKIFQVSLSLEVIIFLPKSTWSVELSECLK